MGDLPRDLTLERINRPSQAIGDLMESHAAQGRAVIQSVERINSRLDRIETRLERVENSLQQVCADLRSVASEQILLGNRVEDASPARFAPTCASMISKAPISATNTARNACPATGVEPALHWSTFVRDPTIRQRRTRTANRLPN